MRSSMYIRQHASRTHLSLAVATLPAIRTYAASQSYMGDETRLRFRADHRTNRNRALPERSQRNFPRRLAQFDQAMNYYSLSPVTHLASSRELRQKSRSHRPWPDGESQRKYLSMDRGRERRGREKEERLLRSVLRSRYKAEVDTKRKFSCGRNDRTHDTSCNRRSWVTRTRTKTPPWDFCFRSSRGRQVFKKLSQRGLQEALPLQALRPQLQEQELAESPHAVRVRQRETVHLPDLPTEADPEEQPAQTHARHPRDLNSDGRTTGRWPVASFVPAMQHFLFFSSGYQVSFFDRISTDAV